MLFALGFVSLFITGGLSGPILAQPILDEYLHNTFFVVAHFHLIMAMAGIFGLFCATYYWYPVMFNRSLNEPLGKLHFWGTFLGAYATFLPMHLTGLAAEPRHYYQLTGIVAPATALLQSTQPLQRFITCAAIFLACAQLPLVLNLLLSLRSPALKMENLWGATTLEWAPAALFSPDSTTKPSVYREPCIYSPNGENFLTQWDSTSTPTHKPE
jgi:cytochrome c oxidase subunit 1